MAFLTLPHILTCPGNKGADNRRSRFNFFSLKNLFFFFFRAVPAAYGGSQARGPIGATAAFLHHSCGNARSEPRLQPTPQLKATPDP